MGIPRTPYASYASYALCTPVTAELDTPAGPPVAAGRVGAARRSPPSGADVLHRGGRGPDPVRTHPGPGPERDASGPGPG